MSYSIPVDQTLMQQWVTEKLELSIVEEKLMSLGFDTEQVQLHLKEYRKLLLAKRQFTAFVLLALGAFLGFISCVLTLINPVPGMYGIILYGLTSVAILIIMYGLYLLFE